MQSLLIQLCIVYAVRPAAAGEVAGMEELADSHYMVGKKEGVQPRVVNNLLVHGEGADIRQVHTAQLYFGTLGC